jgi:hypothetical protein
LAVYPPSEDTFGALQLRQIPLYEVTWNRTDRTLK